MTEIQETQVERLTLTGAHTRHALLDLLRHHPCGCGERRGTFIVDVTASGLAELGFAELMALAEHSRSRSLPGCGVRLALVARTPATFGVCRMLQSLRDDLSDRLSVHGSPEEAAAWLGMHAGA